MAQRPPSTVGRNKETHYSVLTKTFASAVACVSGLNLSVHLSLCKRQRTVSKNRILCRNAGMFRLKYNRSGTAYPALS
jgi:hypothetical protein